MDISLLKEKREHGDFLFPLGCYSMVYHDRSEMLDLHWHDELEFLLMTSGEAVFRVGDLEYTVKKGQALFIRSGQYTALIPTKVNGAFPQLFFIQAY